MGDRRTLGRGNKERPGRMVHLHVGNKLCMWVKGAELGRGRGQRRGAGVEVWGLCSVSKKQPRSRCAGQSCVLGTSFPALELEETDRMCWLLEEAPAPAPGEMRPASVIGWPALLPT